MFGDTVQVTMSQHNFRARPLTAATFAEVNPEKALAFYKDRFADASDFTFVFVGNVDTVSLKPLVEKYLASLPSIGRKETFRDNGGSAPKGVVERVVHKGVEPKANTIIDFTGACQYTPETRFAMRALIELFQIKLNETLREQLGGAYSPSASGGCSRVPRQEYSIEVQFNSVAGERREAVEERVRADRFAQDAGSDAGRRQQGEGRDHARPRGRGQAERLLARQHHGAGAVGRGHRGPARRVRRDDQEPRRAAQIQEAAKKYFDTTNYARFVLLPENGKTTP